jgi:CheY-like chemotaxis protein
MIHILVIDDEASVRTLVRQILEEEGHLVNEAADGEEDCTVAVNSYRSGHHGYFMPHKEGIETIRELRRQFLASIYRDLRRGQTEPFEAALGS